MQQPGYDAAVNVVGTANVLAAAHGRAGDLRLVRAAPATASAPSRRPSRRRSCRSRRTGSPRSAARSTSPAGTASTAPRTSRCGSGTSTARARTPGSKAGSSRSSSSGSRAARRRRSTATASQSRDFVYVADVVAAALAAVGHGGGPYNVGSGVDTSVVELFAALRGGRRQRRARPRHAAARLGDVRRSVLDVSLVERELGWRAEVPLADGLAETWAWTKEAQPA